MINDIIASFAGLILLSILIAVPAFIYVKKNKKNDVTVVTLENVKEHKIDSLGTYHKKKFLTQNEILFLKKLKKIFGDRYIIQPQVPLRMLVSKDGEEYGQHANELNRYIDIGIFNQSYDILALVELNDQTHKLKERYERDLKVQEICQQAKIPLITFWTHGKQTDENIRYIIEKEIESANKNY